MTSPLTAAVALLALTATAVPAAGRAATVSGFGTHRCSDFSAAAVALLALTATAVPAAGRAATVSGFGTHRCSDFSAAAERGQTQAIDGYVSWAQGFISGYNWLNPDRRDIVADPGGLTFWLVEHCAAHPGQRFHDAVRRFIATQTAR